MKPLLLIATLFAVSCGISGRKATYKGVFICAYPTYFIPDKYPDEHWILQTSDFQWYDQLKVTLEADTHSVIREAIKTEYGKTLYQNPIMLGSYGANIEMEVTGIPSKKYLEGIGSHSCCDRTFDADKVSVIKLIFSEK